MMMRPEHDWDETLTLGEQAEEGSRMLPPRRVIHPSEKPIWTRRFYFLLVVLFALLLVCLFLWGDHYMSYIVVVVESKLLYNIHYSVIHLGVWSTVLPQISDE